MTDSRPPLPTAPGPGVLAGIRVLDLSWGLSGPMATMLLADHGAEVTRVESPHGDPLAELSGYRVWNRGKRSAVLDLRDARDQERFLKLAAAADVLVESFSPGVTTRLGIDHDTLSRLNPGLVYCSITAYGSDGVHADRPGIDALVAARTGHNFEGRGVVGGTIGRLAGNDGMLPGLEAPEGCMVGANRDGPLFSGVPWISLATFYLANLGINAALRARQITGRGQWVQTSLLQGALAGPVAAWQRVENPGATNFQSWVIDPRAPKAFYRGSDGKWMHHWTPLPAFVLGATAGGTLSADGASAPRDAPLRIGVNAEDMIVLHHYHPLLAEEFAKFPSSDWIRVAAEVGAPVQPVRSPEEALLDPLLVADGCVAEVDGVRMVGHTSRMAACPAPKLRAAPRRGEHTAEVTAEADALPTPEPVQPLPAGRSLEHPLAGVKVLDLGLAVAGPWGTQQLAELGADVIKVNTAHDSYWMSNHIGMCCNRSKRSIAINLKDPRGLELLHRLVAEADVVQHNMRYEAAERLGVDYESLRAINPALIYCHTRGFELGEREGLPGNDQTGAALAGASWMDGGLDGDESAEPLWSLTSLGDTGNGFLSAIGIVQALYHRDRTGEGQFVDTSIIYAHLLNCSSAWVTPDGSVAGDRHRLDAEQLGMSALYRMYRTADDRWLVLAVFTRQQLSALCAAIGRSDLDRDDHFAPAGNRSARDDELAMTLADAFATRTAAHWQQALDLVGVPAEVSNPDFVLGMFDDPELIEKGWVTTVEHPVVGRSDLFGRLIDFSETPGVVQGPAFIPGQHTIEILTELGLTSDEIDDLRSANVVTAVDLAVPAAH